VERAYVALGSNLGDREANLAAARRGLARLSGTRVLRASGVEETEPLGGREQPPYLNQMVLVETALSPRELLLGCQAIERTAGRVRAAADRWASRTLDLDIVRFGDRQVNEPGLTIPHPALPERDFWQRELAELDAHDERD
jgi:2-amino-4-hydroxy-6-hydroxymethyldihydropteridine diphosphokinase